MEAGQFIATFPDGDGHPKWWFSKGILTVIMANTANGHLRSKGILPKMALNQVKDL